MTTKHIAPAAKDFSTTARRALARKGISIVDSTWLTGPDGSYANGERGYGLDDNGTHRLCSYAQVAELAK